MARATSLIGTGLALLVLAAPTPAQAQSPCANADLQPADAATAAAAADAVVCLVNGHRAAQGIKPVEAQPNLRVAAEAHSADMVARTYFEHISPDGESVVDRAGDAGYTTGHSWILGEALGVGLTSLSTPTAMVDAWLNSPPHRVVLLESRYTDIGVGVIPAMDGLGMTGAAYTADFGHRTADVVRRTKKRTKRRRAVSSTRLGHRARGK